MKKIFYLFLVSVLILSCLDEIDLVVPRQERETVVIQAKLVKGDPSFVRVRVTNLFDFTPASLRQLEVRKVEIFDEEGNNKELNISSRDNFSAFIADNDPDLAIDYGKSYKIRVQLFDNRIFESDLEPLIPVPDPERVDYEFFTMSNDSTGAIQQSIRFLIDSPLKVQGVDDKVSLRWDLESYYKATDSPLDAFSGPVDPKTCYIPFVPGSNEVRVVDAGEIFTEEIENYPIFETSIGGFFAEGYYLNVYQEGLSVEATKYWSQVKVVNERTGNMFESPAGKIITNFRNMEDPIEDEVFGFFYATTQNVIRVYVSPDAAGNPRMFCPPLAVGSNPGRSCNLPPVCCNCLDLEGSSLEKPDWWVE